MRRVPDPMVHYGSVRITMTEFISKTLKAKCDCPKEKIASSGGYKNNPIIHTCDLARAVRG